ncbi:MAG: type II toxin-antitoxin system RelE/ParE family toxin [Rhodospirillaceae bacterium]|nr:type II toxin-antitoxin system RelE/ParE family toxin [Rhodospirillaceae bacterium]
MSGNPVVLRERARRDIDEAVRHYLAEAGPTVALAFVDALEDARRSIGQMPAIGSHRYAHELDVPGLRVRSTERYPHLIFYFEKETEIEIWRVLHGAWDIPARLQEPRED